MFVGDGRKRKRKSSRLMARKEILRPEGGSSGTLLSEENRNRAQKALVTSFSQA